MPMVSRVRDAIRRLIDEYGSSDEEKEKAPKPTRSKKDGSKNSDKSSKKAHSSEADVKTGRKPSSSSSTTSSEEDGHTKERVEEQPTVLPGFLGCDQALGDSAEQELHDNAVSDAESGRVRAFAHFPGSWATFVYLTPRLDGLTSLFNQLINEAMSIEDVKSVKWKMIEDPHISMSRTVTLRYHEIPHFTAHLKAEIVKTSNAKFPYSFEEMGFFSNDQANTSFLALKVGKGKDEMLSLLRIVESCLKSFSMPTFYENPEFHVSFAWCPERVSEEDQIRILQVLEKKLESLHSEFAMDLTQWAKAVQCKSGNRSYLIPL